MINKLDLRANWKTYLPYFLIALLYVIFHQKYMPEYIDDAWVLSWAYGLTELDNITDYVFGLQGIRGSMLFGKGYSYFYGTILNIIGWSRSNAVIISTLFVWGTSFIWYKTVLKMGYKKRVAHTVSILFLVMEIFFALGNKLRSDSMTLFLVSFAFYLFVSRQYLLAGLLSIISFEIHVISVTFYFYIIAYLISIFDDMRNRPIYYLKGAGLFIFGMILGLLYYYFLQHEYLDTFFDTTTHEVSGHAFLSYFWSMKFAWRHLPELVITIIALIVFVKKSYFKEDKFILPFFITTILSTFILRRGNYHYVAFVYPSVILLMAFVATKLDKVKLFFILLSIYLIPQYGYLLKTNFSYNQKDYEANIINIVPQDNLFILGNSASWYPLKDRDFHEYGFFIRGDRNEESVPDSFYLISTKSYRDNINGHKEHNDKLFSNYKILNVDSFIQFNGNRIDVLLYQKENK